MRYLGNKDSILVNIHDLLKTKGLLQTKEKNKTFFDAFCGTGAVSNSLKNYFDIIINDNLKFATVYSAGRMLKGKCDFTNLGFNPFDFFNSNETIIENFFYNNYAPQKSGRMYFSDFNAGRIDYFRQTIETWYNENLISKDEYYYLLSCLLESVSKVANIAGVYGAYLKKWDPRAIKKIKFIDSSNDTTIFCDSKIEIFNNNISDIIRNVDCDILYLDPPYTKNKYPVQYHILETLIKNDSPELKGITGARNSSNIATDWSIPNKVEIEFEKTIALTKAKHILLSYSNDGLMTKDFILNVLKRYCNEKTITVKEIPYKKYRNFKTYNTKEHVEYLFYAEKKTENNISFCCPLNYMGGKSNVINYIKPYMKGKKNFIDLMSGGFNVGINAPKSYNLIYNDINYIVANLIRMFGTIDTFELLSFIDKTIKKYNLQKCNKEAYIKLRTDYNDKHRFSSQQYLYLYVLILYGFQQQIRFNSNYEFNNPVGESGYNDSIKEKIISFSRVIKSRNVEFYNCDYEDLEKIIDENSLVYIDPPYLITLGSYNDGKRGFKGWNEFEEKRLISFLEKIKQKNCKIIISNILEYKNNTNTFLQKWILDNNITPLIVPCRKRNEVLLIYEGNI